MTHIQCFGALPLYQGYRILTEEPLFIPKNKIYNENEKSLRFKPFGTKVSNLLMVLKGI